MIRRLASSVARRGACLLAVLALAAAAGAQDKIRFDPSRDLEGFDDCFASEFREIFPLETYSDMLAKEMPRAELAEIQKQWKSDLAAATKKLETLRADPVEESLWLLRHRLAKSAFFSRIAWTEDRSIPGFVLLVENSGDPGPDRAAAVAKKYGPWLSKIGSVFDDLYAKPLALERQHGRSISALAVLTTQKEYHAFWNVHPNHVSTSASACYDLRLGLAVGFDDAAHSTETPFEQRYPILNAVVRGLIDAYSSTPEGRPGSLWIEEGLASYIAYHEGESPSALEERRIRFSTIRSVLDLALDKKKGPLLIHPIEDLVALKSSEEVDKIAYRLAKATRTKAPSEDDVLAAFYGQAHLWMHFLHRGMGKSLRAPTLEYLRAAFSGEAGASVLAKAFAGQDLARIDREFLDWFVVEARKVVPSSVVDEKKIETLFDVHTAAPPDPPAEPVAPEKSAAAGKPAVPDPSATDKPAPEKSAGDKPASEKAGTDKTAPKAKAAPPRPADASGARASSSAAFTPAELAAEATDVESQHGLALVRAREGDLEGALERLKRIGEGEVEAPDRARIERDQARVGELVKLRDGFLENLRASGGKWSFESQGKKVSLGIAKVEGGIVTFAGSRPAVEKIPLASIDPLEVAKQATKKEQQGNSASWARLYAFVLAEDPKWEKLPKDSSEEARLLREDAKSWIPARLQVGRMAAALETLSKTALPKAGPEGEAVCDAIRDLVVRHADSPLVQRKKPQLRRFAQIAAQAAAEKVEPATWTHGKWTPLENGRAKVVYDFEDELQAGDFQKQPGYLKSLHDAQTIQAAAEDASSWAVKNGRFVGVGSACYRLPIGFRAPMSVQYRLRVLEGVGDATMGACFAVGLCDDEKEDLVLAVNFGSLEVHDPAHGVDQVVRSETESYLLRTSYVFDVLHDGKTVSVSVEGKKSTEASCTTLQGGQVLFWFHTNLPIAIENLEIQAAVDPAASAGLRKAAVERKLAEMGFP